MQEPTIQTDNLPSAIHAAISNTGRVSSTELFGHRRIVEILHDNCIYQLRLTANGKLILTK